MTLALLLAPAMDGILHALGDACARMLTCLRAFVFLLTHDTAHPAASEHLVPFLLAAWALASLLAALPGVLLVKLMGSSQDLRRVTLIHAAVMATQVSFLAVNWYVIGWGHRSIDWAVFGAALVPSWLIAKLGLDLSFDKALVQALLAPVFALAWVFLGVFALVEMGQIHL